MVAAADDSAESDEADEIMRLVTLLRLGRTRRSSSLNDLHTVCKKHLLTFHPNISA